MSVSTIDRTEYDRLRPLLARLTGDEKHEPSAYDTLDPLWVLYDQILRVDPHRLDDPERDRFLLSKGHGPHAYYAVLAAKGFIPEAWLDDLAGADSRLGHHPDRVLVPGAEIGSGSLGHGLGLAVGTALGLRAQGRSRPRVYVLVGDGELDEGSNHEAIHYAGAVGLESLTVIAIDNHTRAHELPGGLAGLFTVAGWTDATVAMTGAAPHRAAEHAAFAAAVQAHRPGRPHAVIVDTRRGGGA